MSRPFLENRSFIIHQIRDFFKSRDVLEVETPLLYHSSATDPVIESFLVHANNDSVPYYLQTSPELPMKRLLAEGAGSIYQIGKVFRQEEKGRRHSPEFTMCEWYRVGFDHHQLMNEVDELLQMVLGVKSAEKITYKDLFNEFFSIDPHSVGVDELKNYVVSHQINLSKDEGLCKDDYLNLLMTHVIEPKLSHKSPVFIYDYPETQGAMARLREEKNYSVAERFEVYVNGVELANGYHELTDPEEQLRRFEKDNQKRKLLGLNEIPIDREFIKAMEVGMPDCAGVALGVDRLIMCAIGAEHISEVIRFYV